MGDDPLLGKTIAGRYVVERRIGQGGMGAVYSGRQEPLGRPVAIKVLLQGVSADMQAAERFQVEATAVARLNHPGIVTIYDYGKTDDGMLFLAMELLEGRSLRKHLDSKGKRLPWPEALSIARQTASALAAAHEKGIVHRDLKPDNLMLVEREGGVVVKVLDFGLAKVVEGGGQQLTQRSVIMGTPGYMSPEQIHGMPIDARCDLYALGVMFWEMVVGRAPIVDDAPLKILMRHLTEEIPAPSFACREAGLPGAADEVILRLLQKERDKRPSKTQYVVDVLDRLAAEPWVAPAQLALPQGATKFDAADWDETFSVLSDGSVEKKKPQQAKQETLVLKQVVEDPPAPPPAPADAVTAVVPSPSFSAFPLPPPSAPQQQPPPAPPPPIPAAPTPATQANPFIPPPANPFAAPSPPPPPPGNPFAPPPNRFGPPVAQQPLALEVERPKTKVSTTTTAPAAKQQQKEPLDRRVKILAAVLGAGVLFIVVDLATHWDGFTSSTDKRGPDAHSGDVLVAANAREAQGTKLALDDAIDRLRLAADTTQSEEMRTRLAELLAERALLQGDFDDGGANEARALRASVTPRGKAALWLALGNVSEARAALGEVPADDKRGQALLAEIVAERDPNAALTLVERAPGELGTRPLRAKARALLAMGNVEGALLALDERLAAVPEDVTARSLRARARFENDDDAAARADLDAAWQKSPLAFDALTQKLRQPQKSPKELDALLAHLQRFDLRHPSRAAAAQLDALRLNKREKQLQRVLDESKELPRDAELAVARAHARLVLDQAAEAGAEVEAVDVNVLTVRERSRVLALRLAARSSTATSAAALVAIRPASAVVNFAHHIDDPSRALPAIVARPRQALDDDEQLILEALAPADAFGKAIKARLLTGSTAELLAYTKQKPAEARGLLLLAWSTFERGDLALAQKLLQRVTAQKELSEAETQAMHLLSAQVQMALGNATLARANLQGLPQAMPTLLAGSRVDVIATDLAGARGKLEQARRLDALDRGIPAELRRFRN